MSNRNKRPILRLKPKTYIPCTPAGTPCIWLASATEAEAWEKLLKDAAHMPYSGKKGFQDRGYTVIKISQ